MSRLQQLAIAYLIFLVGIAWGIGIGRYDIFPASILKEALAFVRGHPAETSSAAEKLLNDFDIKPERLIYAYDAGPSENYRPLTVPGLRSRRALPRVFLSPEAPKGYRVLFGAFDMEESLWGALLIGPDGKFVHRWKLSTDHLPNAHPNANQKNMYGVAVFPDGSIIFSMHEAGGGIVRVGACSRDIWTIEGRFHHVASPTGHGTFWTFEGFQHDLDHVLAEFSVETGETIRKIDMKQVRQSSDINIFDLRPLKYSGKPAQGNAVHGNDIEPLPAILQDKFPDFEPGDLLISYRMINLVFVLDPDTLEVKWWRVGPWDTQHDPDWDEDGMISVYSNNWRAPRGYSDIIGIDPATLKTKVLIDGKDFGFYSKINGRHQRRRDGSVFVTSSTQGRAFEVSPKGHVVFDFLNTYQEGENLHLAEALFLEEDFFDDGALSGCGPVD